MTKRFNLILLAVALLAFTGMAFAQSTTLNVSVGPEAALTVNTGSTTLANTGTNFGTDYTGSTSLTYKIRTTKTTGTGTLSLKVSGDFAPAGGPSVATPPSSGDALSYTSTVSAPGTAATGSTNATTSTSTNIGTFGAGANSAKAGNSASVSWTLTNDPAYSVGSYSATVTFTISAT